MSKSSDKFWHEELLYKLNSIGNSGRFCKLIESYLSNIFQRVVLNGQASSWRPILAGLPQGSILGPLLFLRYVNDMLNGLKSNVKLFADDTSTFSIVKNKNDSAKDLIHDLSLISKLAYKWKMLFTPDATKLAQEVIFSRKKDESAHPSIFCNDIPVERASHQKYLEIYLDKKLNFKMHIKTILYKINHCSLLIACCSLVFARCSLIFARCSLFTTFYLFLVTFYSLLDKKF